MIFFSAIFAVPRGGGPAECQQFEGAMSAGHVGEQFAIFERMIVGNSDEALAFREKYVGCDLWMDGRLRTSLQWPSQAETKAKEIHERRMRATSLLREKEDRARQFAEAADRARVADAEVRDAQAELDAIEAETRGDAPADKPAKRK
jgi:hypothetical protein